MFGFDDSRTISFKLDNNELNFQYFGKKRNYDLKIGIIEKLYFHLAPSPLEHINCFVFKC